MTDKSLSERLRDAANSGYEMPPSQLDRLLLEAATALTPIERQGEREEVVRDLFALTAYVTGLDDELRWTPEFTRYVNERFNEIASAIRSAKDTPPTPTGEA